MTDTLTWSVIISAAGTVLVGITTAIVAFRTSKMNTEVAVSRIVLDDKTSTTNQWKEIAQNWKTEAQENKAEVERLEQEVEKLKEEIRTLRNTPTKPVTANVSGFSVDIEPNLQQVGTKT